MAMYENAIVESFDKATKSLKVSTASQSATTPFGELATAEFQPQAGWMFSYNINPATIKSQSPR